MDAVDALAARLALAAVDRAPARLERDIAAIAGGPDDGAAHLAADGRRQHPRRHGGRRAGRRAARRPRRVEGVGGRARMRTAEFRGHGLGEDQRAGLAKRRDRRIVAFREIAPIRPASHLCRHGARFQQVLDADRHAVHRRKRPAGAPAFRARIRRLARALDIGRNQRLKHRLPRLDDLKAAFQINARRIAALAKGRKRVVEGQAPEGLRVVSHGASLARFSPRCHDTSTLRAGALYRVNRYR